MILLKEEKMQEKNIITNAYWSDSRRFADIINVGMFRSKKVLSAAAMTYVAATIVALGNLLRLLSLARRDD